MISESKLLARKHQIESGRVIYIALLFLFVSVVIFSALPSLYRLYVLPFFTGNTKLLSLTVSVLMIFFIFNFCKCIELGFKRFFLKKAENYNASFKDILYFFKIKNYIRVFTYFVKKSIYKGFFFLICLFPFVVAVFLFSNTLSGISFSAGCLIVLSSLLLLFNGLIYYKKISASLFLADYYYIKGEYVSFSHLIASSQNSMKNKANEFSKMRVSFIGWFALCIFIVPVFYVFGYYSQCMAVLAEKYIKE